MTRLVAAAVAAVVLILAGGTNDLTVPACVTHQNCEGGKR